MSNDLLDAPKLTFWVEIYLYCTASRAGDHEDRMCVHSVPLRSWLRANAMIKSETVSNTTVMIARTYRLTTVGLGLELMAEIEA